MVEPVSAGVLAGASALVWRPLMAGLGKKLADKIGSLTTAAADKLAVALRLGFADYLLTSYNRCKLFKTILNPAEPLNVLEHYVHVTFSNGRKTLNDDDLIAGMQKLNCAVVTGLAGSGKSMFMRYLTLWYFHHGQGITPLFVELRKLNGITKVDLLTFIRSACSSKLSVLTEHQFHLGLQAGIFMLILDGFDEMNHDIRSQIQNNILEIRKDFTNTNIVISSRPDDRFDGWAEFHVFKVNELTKKQTLKLLDTLPYDSNVKKRFAREVSDRLYDSHKSFMSSPLLATIMLLTFEGFAEIPDKMHSFYGKAFDTLFQKHDATKEQFQRKTHSGLPLEEFKAYFAAFCAMSYLRERYSFDQKLLSEIAGQAIKYVGENEIQGNANKDTKRAKKPTPACTPQQLIDDLLESVCMLQPDGIHTSFVHRSFQEYFAAYFVTGLHGEKIKKILDRYCVRSTDSAMPMLLEMHREPVEQSWVLPVVRELESVFQLIDEKGVYAVVANFTKTLGIELFGVDPSRAGLHEFSFSVGEGFNILLFSQFDTLCYIYPQFMPPERLYGIKFSRGLLTKNILQTRYKEMAGYAEFQTLISSALRGKKSAVPTTITRILSASDEWWLEELGFRERIMSVRKGLKLIASNIEAVSARRESILEAFI